MSARVTPMRGFSCAVGSASDRSGLAHAGIAVGASGTGEDRRYSIALRHADGSMMTATLSDQSLDRLADLLADLVVADGPVSAPTLAAGAGSVH